MAHKAQLSQLVKSERLSTVTIKQDYELNPHIERIQ